ncbi:MAG: flagellar hook-associated protein FlgK [candidate division Zixibacteria bacterium]|nr:flagellar hook-associated protein FlgK [candidate division Zixibacteria bacterium]
MPGLMQGLEVGKRALLTHQISLQTIGHNIANVNTPGFTRQRVTVTSTYPEDATFGQIGSGVTATGVRQIRDLFLGTQYREAKKSEGQWGYKSKTLSQIESLFNEPNESSLNDLLNGFFDSWSQLATNSDSSNNRKLVLATANQLINGIRQLAQKLDELRTSVDRDMVTMTKEINQLTREIAGINQQIKSQELGGQTANDLRDQRDLLTDQLAELIDVRVIEKDNGATIVQMGGMALVDGGDSFDIGADLQNRNGQPISQLVWQGTAVQLRNKNGQLAGLIQSRDELIPQYQAQLDELARTLVTEVNAIHALGYGLDGTTGYNFFDPNFTDALTIRISPAITEDINKMAAGLTIDGDNEVALRLSELRNSAVMSNSTQSMNDFYSSLIGTLGVETHEASSFTSNYELLAQQIDNSRQSVQGVSLDEELANLVKYQHAYDAAARVITTMDQALDTVIGSMGIVGR